MSDSKEYMEAKANGMPNGLEYKTTFQYNSKLHFKGLVCEGHSFGNAFHFWVHNPAVEPLVKSVSLKFHRINVCQSCHALLSHVTRQVCHCLTCPLTSRCKSTRYEFGTVVALRMAWPHGRNLIFHIRVSRVWCWRSLGADLDDPVESLETCYVTGKCNEFGALV